MKSAEAPINFAAAAIAHELEGTAFTLGSMRGYDK